MTELQRLARFVAGSRTGRIAEPVQDEAVRALVDWLGCCLGGCLEAPADAIEGHLAPPDSTQATLPGIGSRDDLATVALRSAIASEVLDFAATHAATGASVSVPIAAALLPLAEARSAGGADLVHAYVLGSEIACRLGAAVQDDDGATSALTELCGGIGAALACGKLIGLDADALAHACGVAALTLDTPGGTAPSGARFGAARAARNGLRAALLAERRTPGALDAGDILTASVAADAGLAAWLRAHRGILDGLGEEWQLVRTAYKPYPCDWALHAAIEACLAVRSRLRPLPRQIASVRLHLHPAVLARSNRPAPEDSVQARRSIQHAAAATLVDGAAGVEQFGEARVASGRVAAMRARIEVDADASMPVEGARLVLTLVDGRSAEQAVRCAHGSPARPLTDAELSDKFRDLACEVLATDQAERLLALAWNVRALGDVGALVRTSVPEDALEPSELPGSPLIPR